jgi:maleylpyruvate isomerase
VRHHPLGNLRVLQYLRAEFGQGDEAIARWNREWMSRGFTALETWIARHSADGRHCFGSAVTLADVCLLPQVFNSRRVQLDLAPWPGWPAWPGISKTCRRLPRRDRRRSPTRSEPDRV